MSNSNIQYICKVNETTNALEVLGINQNGLYTPIQQATFLDSFSKDDIPVAIYALKVIDLN